MRIIVLCALLLLANSFVLGQSDQALLHRARAYVDTLCSPTMAGRGYIENGHIKAAQYIANQYESMGLRSIGSPKDGFFQPFQIEINKVAGAEVEANGQKLEAGLDFIVNRFSGAGKVEGEWLDVGYGLKPKAKAKGRILVMRAGWPRKLANSKKKRQRYGDLARPDARVDAWLAYEPAAIIILQEKLTAGFARQQKSIPIIEVQRDSLPKSGQISLSVDAGLTRIQTQNVLGLVPGTRHPDSVVVVCAHYDHLGMLEKARFTGANDNASGTAMMLSMAEYFQQHPMEHSMLFIAFGGEETGLLGSGHFVHRDQQIPLANMSFVLNLDLMGNGVDGIMAVGGRDFPGPFDQLVQLNDTLKSVPVVRSRKNAPNSDHYYFLEQGVPGFFIYTLGGPPHYHDVRDNPTNLQFSRYIEVRELLIAFLEQL